MLTRFKLPRRGPKTEKGQILVIFAFAFVAIIMMLALLFDGAQALVLRRQMQDAADAAAMAGANLIQGLAPPGCSANVGYPPGAPQAAIVAAAKASIAANLPNYNPANVVVTCPLDHQWTDGQGHTPAVQVDLFDQAPTFFGQIFGGGPLNVATRGAAVNGQDSRNAYSVVLLDTHVTTWPQARQGCPSFLLSGGPTVTFDSSVYVNSSCLAVDGGALSTNGNSASLTLGANGPTIRIVGEYKPQALTITPTPLQHQNAKPDPLATLLPPPGSPNFLSSDSTGLKVQRTTKLTLNNSTQTLEPGVYKGGIQLKNTSIAYLHPGIYVLQGGGLDLGAQSSVYSVPAGTVPANIATTWDTTCTTTNCGVLIYNTGDANGGSAMGQISVGAGATFKVRSYDPTASVTLLNNGTSYTNQTYNNLLIWQTATPAETASYEQPWLLLNGGGSVVMNGTVYAPQAKVQMGGNAGGSGGSNINLTLQFIVWDLELSGNSNFHFIYDGSEFATPLDYGLMQ